MYTTVSGGITVSVHCRNCCHFIRNKKAIGICTLKNIKVASYRGACDQFKLHDVYKTYIRQVDDK